MNYISLFSGIEAASVAWKPLGWQAVKFAEFDDFPSAVLAHHYPDVENVGDVTKHDWSQYRGQVDVLIGGFPCQAFSVAGLRNSLEDDRGNLSLEFCRILDDIEPRYTVAENVPGWLTTSDNAFGCFLGAVVGADAALVPAKGQRWSNAGMVVGTKRAAAWRVLDAQYFGVAQRRRRVFVVICPRDGANPAAVLFERESLCGNPPPRREAGQSVAGTLKGGSEERGYPYGRLQGCSGQDVNNGCGHLVVGTLAASGAGSARPAGNANEADMLVFDPKASASHGMVPNENIAPGLHGQHSPAVLRERSTVRRLLPVECERLQAFPDGSTDIPYKGRPASDSARYKALGNSMCVNVIRWIGQRIAAVDRL